MGRKKNSVYNKQDTKRNPFSHSPGFLDVFFESVRQHELEVGSVSLFPQNKQDTPAAEGASEESAEQNSSDDGDLRRLKDKVDM